MAKSPFIAVLVSDFTEDCWLRFGSFGRILHLRKDTPILCKTYSHKPAELSISAPLKVDDVTKYLIVGNEFEVYIYQMVVSAC